MMAFFGTGLLIGSLLFFGVSLVTDEYAPAGDVRMGWALIALSGALTVAVVALTVWAYWWPVGRRSGPT